MEQPWQSVRHNLEDHAQYLFRQFSTIYRVLEEASFANDEGGVGDDHDCDDVVDDDNVVMLMRIVIIIMW